MQGGQLRYVVRDFPLESIHPHAFRASEAALCAGEQGRYWEMHDRLFAHQKALGPAELPEHARAAGLDVTAFERCLAAGRHAEQVRRDQAEGQQAGVRGTPTFFLGVAEPGGKTVQVKRIVRGAQPFPVFRAAIEAVLAETER